MFDIGVSELFVIGVVALVVIGPEKLPRVARTIGHLTGRLQRYVNDVKADINREIELEELRRFKQEVEQTAHSFESSVRAEMGKTESELNQAAQQLADLGSDLGAAPAPTDAMALPAHPAGELPDAQRVTTASADAQHAAVPSPDAQHAAVPSPDAQPVATASSDARPVATALSDTQPVAVPSPETDGGKPGEGATSPGAAREAGSG